GGAIGAVSRVDRGSIKNTAFRSVRAAKGGPAELVARLSGPRAVGAMFGPAATKRQLKDGSVVDSSGKDRSGTADDDFAGPNKTYPIDNEGDVSDAASL